MVIFMLYLSKDSYLSIFVNPGNPDTLVDAANLRLCKAFRPSTITSYVCMFNDFSGFPLLYTCFNPAYL